MPEPRSPRPAAMTASRGTARQVLALRSCPEALVTPRPAWGSPGRQRPGTAAAPPGGHQGPGLQAGKLRQGGECLHPITPARLPAGPGVGKAGGGLGWEAGFLPPA